MYESVDALNYFAMRISELEDTEMTVFQTALKAGECNGRNKYYIQYGVL